MKYTIYFYGLASEHFTTKLQAKNTIERTLDRARKSSNIDEQDLKVIASILNSGVRGDWPHSDLLDGFIAFHWLLEATAEPILVGDLIDFRNWSYWESAGLWRYFIETLPPFPVPTSPDDLPKVGFIAHTVMESVCNDLHSGTSKFTHDAWILRTELLEIFESLVEDKLDLISIYLN